MAYSNIQYTGDGSNRIFSVPFPYISRNHVVVTVGGVPTADYTWLTTSSIETASAPAAGVSVDIRRTSSRAARIVDFQDATPLTEGLLNQDANQAFYVSQEAFDAASDLEQVVDTDRANAASAVAQKVSKAGDTMTGPLAMSGNKITGLADPADDQDVVNRRTLWSKVAEIVTAAQAGLGAFIAAGVDAVARSFQDKLRESVSVEDFMLDADRTANYLAPGSVDVTYAFQALLSRLKLNVGRAHLASPAYLVSEELVFDAPGISLVGRGTGTTWDGLENAATRIIGSHASGAVIRIKWENCGLKNITIDATGDRLAAARNTTAASYNAGIRVEANDVAAPEGDVFTTRLQNVYVRNQPNDGIIMVGRVYQSQIEDVFCAENKGHGFVIDAGNRTGRTNVFVPGVVNLQNVYCFKNDGHGIVAGNPNDDAATLLSSLRIVAINCESNSNNVDPALRYGEYDAYIRGDNNVFIGCAFGGKNAAGTLQHHGGLMVAGRDNRFMNSRYLDTSQPARVAQYTGVTTTGTVFDGMSVRASLVLTPVTIDTGAINTLIRITDGTSVTAPSANYTSDGIEFDYGKVRYKHGTVQASDFKSAFNKSIADDAVSTLEFSGTAYGIIAIAAPTATAGPAIYSFRVGSSPYCKLIAGDATYNEATTGALTGTTGTDTKLTLSAHTDYKLYIENRTSTSRVYEFTIMSINSGRLLPGQ